MCDEKNDLISDLTQSFDSKENLKLTNKLSCSKKKTSLLLKKHSYKLQKNDSVIKVTISTKQPRKKHKVKYRKKKTKSKHTESHSMLYDLIPDTMIEKLTKTEEAIEFHHRHKQMMKDSNILHDSCEEPVAFVSEIELPTNNGRSDPMFSSTMIDSNDESCFNSDKEASSVALEVEDDLLQYPSEVMNSALSFDLPYQETVSPSYNCNYDMLETPNHHLMSSHLCNSRMLNTWSNPSDYGTSSYLTPPNRTPLTVPTQSLDINLGSSIEQSARLRFYENQQNGMIPKQQNYYETENMSYQYPLDYRRNNSVHPIHEHYQNQQEYHYAFSTPTSNDLRFHFGDQTATNNITSKEMIRHTDIDSGVSSPGSNLSPLNSDILHHEYINSPFGSYGQLQEMSPSISYRQYSYEENQKCKAEFRQKQLALPSSENSFRYTNLDVNDNQDALSKAAACIHLEDSKDFQQDIYSSPNVLVESIDRNPPFSPMKKRNSLNKCGIKKTKKNGEKSIYLWEFLRNTLLDPETSPKIIRWENREEGIFRFVESDAIARLWGKHKCNPNMTYEKLSRAMRYYYERKILDRVAGRRLVYKFGPESYGWRLGSENTEIKMKTSRSLSSRVSTQQALESSPASEQPLETPWIMENDNISLPSANVLLPNNQI